MKSQISNLKSQILIVGAGPAGASAAIRLAQLGFSVTLVEREKFPREKLCGEFISPECFTHFRELGVFEEMLSKGGDRITETVFYAPSGKSVSIPSKWFDKDESALGLSRARMDFQLLEKARTLGVEIWQETSAVGVLQEDGKLRGVKVRTKKGEIKELLSDLTIDATGRARVLGKMAEKDFLTRKGRDAKTQGKKGRRGDGETGRKFRIPQSAIRNRFVGFKAHLRNAEIEKGVCEIYFFRGGYGGLNLVENGLSNHCFLVRADLVKEFSGDTERILREVIFQNKRARETLKNTTPVYDWLAVSVDEFGIKDLNPAENLLAIGDAGAFIDPFTGSGILMALESGEILARSFAENFCRKKIAESYKLQHRQKFQKRLRVCSAMRRAAFAPNFASFAISALSLSHKSRQLLARATRPEFFNFQK